MDAAPLLLSFYGDDFTGSTDVMEALARSGIRTVLFLEPPTPDRLAQFPGVRAVGVAGLARSMSSGQMDAELPPIFEALCSLHAPIFHYKTCSTFDSSPEIGSIGRAIDIGQAIFASPFVAMVVGAPCLGRYCVFGNLFARSGPHTRPYRLDRHPTMSRHPITPMQEADLRLHLGQQTGRKIELLDVLELADAQRARKYLDVLVKSGGEIILFDVLSDRELPIIGQLIAQGMSAGHSLFAAGSSGIEYALTAHWREAGQLPPPPLWAHPGRAERIIAVSGSCSPVTDGQIRWCLDNGFEQVSLDPQRLIREEQTDHEIQRAVRESLEILNRGGSVIIHTAHGPDDPRINQVQSMSDAQMSSRIIGERLGEILQSLLRRASVTRIAIAGGDTSGQVARRLQIEALEMIAPMAPGSPLCRIHSPGQPVHGLEIVFKGGQVGSEKFFGNVLIGNSDD